MANLTQTASSVGIGSSSTTATSIGGFNSVQAGEAITQGMPVYLSSTDGKYYKADANASSSTAQARGIALTPASTNGYFIIHNAIGAYINLGATLTVGTTYVVSATAGAICPIADLTTGDYPCILGTAYSSSLLLTAYSFAGVAKP